MFSPPYPPCTTTSNGYFASHRPLFGIAYVLPVAVQWAGAHHRVACVDSPNVTVDHFGSRKLTDVLRTCVVPNLSSSIGVDDALILCSHSIRGIHLSGDRITYKQKLFINQL